MNKQQIIATLAPLYRLEYDAYTQLGALAKEAAQDGETLAFMAINKRAIHKSHFLDGVKAAVEALGINEAEFMEAVNQDRPAQAGDIGKEEEKCLETC